MPDLPTYTVLPRPTPSRRHRTIMLLGIALGVITLLAGLALVAMMLLASVSLASSGGNK